MDNQTPLSDQPGLIPIPKPLNWNLGTGIEAMTNLDRVCSTESNKQFVGFSSQPNYSLNSLPSPPPPPFPPSPPCFPHSPLPSFPIFLSFSLPPPHLSLQTETSR